MVQMPIEVNREQITVTTAANARPHFDFTISILPVIKHGIFLIFLFSFNIINVTVNHFLLI